MSRILISSLLFTTLFLSKTPADEQTTDSRRPLPEQMKTRMKEFREKQKLAESAAIENLNGREVSVRVYDNWQENRTEFKEVYIRLEGNVLNLNSVYTDPNTAAVVLKENQQDEMIKDTLGIEPIVLRGQKRITFPPGRFAGTEKVWIFKDGAGNPISLATGEILCIRKGSDGNEPTRAASFILNESGKCMWRYTNDSKKMYFYILLSHPDYGVHRFDAPLSFRINPWYAYEEYEYYIPCVPEGTEAYSRSIRGFVVDDANNPIECASVRCRFLYTPDRRVVYNRGYKDIGCLSRTHTDKNGWFCMYLPTEEYDRNRLIPLNSSYCVRIEAPKESGLVPFVGEIKNDAECTIKMNEHGYFHTFVFMDEGGIVTDTDKLSKTNLEICRPNEENLDYDYEDFKDGGYFSSGTYKVWTNYGLDYELIEVTKDSPEELVFKLKGGATYKGRVVNGITGKPLKGAFVIGLTHIPIAEYGGKNLSHITEEQWDKLHKLGDSFFVDEDILSKMLIPTGFAGRPKDKSNKKNYPDEYAVFEPLASIFLFEKGVRTGPNGDFSISFGSSEVFGSLLAFEKDYLAVERVKDGLEADSNGIVKVPTMPLYPAATVRAKVLTDEENLWVRPFWVIDTNSLPKWAGKPDRRETYEDSTKHIQDDTSDSNVVLEDKQVYPYAKPSTNVVLLYMLYDFLTANRASFFGIPIKFQRRYNYAFEETIKIDSNDYVARAAQPLERAKDDPNKFPTFYEIYERLFWSFQWNQAALGNHAYSFQVPASLNLNLKFFAKRDPDLKWVPFIFPQKINLKQGETLDLGTGEIKLAPQVFVKVLDSKGTPVENIPVQHWFEGYGMLVTKNTDKNGTVSFYGRYNHNAKFVISSDTPTPTLKKEVPYKIVNKEDEGREFVLQISDELLEHLLK